MDAAVSSTYPGPLQRKVPDGSLIFDPSVTSAFHAVGDMDGFGLTLDAGQAVTVVFTPLEGSIQGKAEVFDPGSVSRGSASASSAGDTVILQTAPAATGGAYRIDATSLAGTGRYRIQVILNAAQEEETGGGSNDTIGTAEDIDGSSIGLQGAAERLAVVGTVGSDLVGRWYSIASRSNTLHEIDPANGSTIRSIAIELPGKTVIGGNGLATNPLTGELFAMLRLSGQSSRELVTIDPATGIATSIGNTGDRFSSLAFDSAGTLYGMTGNGGNPRETLYILSTADATRTFLLDLQQNLGGMAMAFNPVDGLLYHLTGRGNSSASSRLFRAINPSVPSSTPIALTGDTFGYAAAMVHLADNRFLMSDIWEDNVGLFEIVVDGLSTSVVTRLGTVSHDTKGLALVPPSGLTDTADVYSFTLAAGQSATMVAASQDDDAEVDLQLLDSSGTVLALGAVDATNVNSYIRDFVSPEGGTYNVRVSTSSGRNDYSLTLTRAATFDLEANGSAAEAQDISLSGQVLGHAGARVSASGADVSSSYTLYDGEGFEWDIRSSAYISDGTSDAYDGGHELSGFPGQSTFGTEENGREIAAGPAVISSLNVTRKVYVPADQGFARFLEIIENPQASQATYTVAIHTNLGSDSSTELIGTSSGDNTFTIADDWLVTDDSSDGGNDPTVLHVIAGPGGQRPSTASITSGDDDINYTYDLTLDPGETKIIMHFGAQSANRAVALAKAPQLTALGLDALAGMTSSERAAVVNFVIPPVIDHFTFLVNEADSLVITTTTPGDGPGEPVNGFDPAIELFDENGVSVATDDNSAADGRNALLNYTVPGGSSGTYRILVDSNSNTAGEYTLSVSGATGGSPAFAVSSTDPADEGLVNAYPGTYRVDFSQPFLVTSLDPGDLLVNGIAATSVTAIDHDSAEFDISGADIEEAVYSVSMAGGAVTSLAGPGVAAFSGTFTFDVTPPKVVSSSISDGNVVQAGTVVYQAGFSEAMSTDGLGPEDVTLVDSLSGDAFTADSVTYDGGTDTVTVTYNNLPEGDYTLTLLSTTDAFRDVAGTPLDGEPNPSLPSGDGVAGGDYVVTFDADVIAAGAYPVPLMGKLPPGSLIYDPMVSGAFHIVGNVDAYTLDMDAGQSVTVVLTPLDGSIRGKVELFDPGATSVDSASAASAGDAVFLQGAPAATTGTYRIDLTSLAGTGRYTVRVILNAAAEEEAPSALSNDTIATAENIDGSSISLQGGASHVAVVGTVGSDLEDTWYSIDAYDDVLYVIDPTDGSTLDTIAIQLPSKAVYGGNGLAVDPSTGELYAIVRFDSESGTRDLVRLDPATGIATSIGDTGDRFSAIAFDSSGTLYGMTGYGGITAETLFSLSTTDATLTFLKTFEYDLGGEALVFNPTDGLLYHHTGSWSGVFQAINPVTLTFTPITLTGVTYGSVTAMAYMGADSFLLASFNDIYRITLNGDGTTTVTYLAELYSYSKGLASTPASGISDPRDVYSFTLGAGGSATIVVTSQGRRDLDIELLDSSGTLLTRAVEDAANVGAYVLNFVSAPGGTYYVRVTAPSWRTQYTVTVTRNAAFGLEPNDLAADAQDITVSGQVLGHVDAISLEPPTGTTVSLPRNLFDGDGYLWDVQTDGRVRYGSGDAYDAGHDLSGFPGFTSALLDPSGREIAIGPASSGSFEVLRKRYVPSDQAYARFLEIVTNTGSVRDTYTVSIYTNLGSGSATVVVGTYSGDTTFAADDNWIVTDDASDGVGDPTILHVIAGQGGQRPSSVSFSFDNINYVFSLTLDPGETKIVMHFGAQNPNRDTALAKAPLLTSLGLGALTGMSEAEKALVVNFVAGPPRDQYAIQVNEGDSLVITTTTPGDGAGEPVNNFDPVVQLFDENGVSVATNDNSAGDGRNAFINYTVPVGSSGTYRMVIRGADTNVGEYTLAVSGATGALPPFRITTMEPASGTLLSLFPDTYRVDFSHALLRTSAEAGDLLVNGVPAASVTIVDNDTLEFGIAATAAGDGVYTVTMAAGAVTSLSGVPLSAFSATFNADTTSPTVVASSISEGATVASGNVVYQVRFSEDMEPTGLGGEDVTLVETLSSTSISPDSFSYDSGTNTATVTYLNLREGNYILTLLSSATAFRDLRDNLLDGTPSFPLPSGDGTPGDPFVVNFKVDNAGEPFPVALESVSPIGSLIYDPPVRGLFHAVGDVDTYTIVVDSGQTITVRFTPVASSTVGKIELFDPGDTSLGAVTASAAGNTAIFQTAPASTYGTYTFDPTSLAGTGFYDIQVILNAALEAEQYGGASDDSIGTAQDINSSAIALQGSAERMAVLGQTELGSGDYFAFDLQAGEFASLALTSLAGGAADLALYDASGVLALGAGGYQNVTRAISDFMAPSAGTFFARVSLVVTDTPYSLVVTTDATFDLELIAGVEAQDLGHTYQALGSISALDFNVEPDDFPAGTVLNTAVPGVVLSVVGAAEDVTSVASGIPSTGSCVFAHGANALWNSGSRWLRADFSSPVYAVSIDIIGPDSYAPGILQAYDVNGVLLEQVTKGGVPAGQP